MSAPYPDHLTGARRGEGRRLYERSDGDALSERGFDSIKVDKPPLRFWGKRVWNFLSFSFFFCSFDFLFSFLGKKRSSRHPAGRRRGVSLRDGD